MGTDMKSNPTDDRHNTRVDFPRGLLGAHSRSAPIGASAIENLAAPLDLAAHVTTTTTGNLVIEMLFVMMLLMALTLRITRILVDEMRDILAMFVTNAMLLAAPFRVKFIVLIATVSRMADDLLLWSKRLGGYALVDRNFDFFKRGDQTCHLLRLPAATMRTAAVRGDRPGVY